MNLSLIIDLEYLQFGPSNYENYSLVPELWKYYRLVPVE